MTQEEFFEEMEKIKSSLIPGHSKACACLQGNDHNIELVRSDVGVETAIGVMVKWCKEPASCIDLLLRFPKLKSLFFFYGADKARRVIRRSWEGLSKLKNLESLRIQDCVLLTNEALEEISKLSSLRNLEIINRLDEGLDFSVLGKLKNLRRGCCKTSKKVSNSLFLLFEQKVGDIISHDRRISWLILQILKAICSFAQTFRLRKNKNWTITSNFWKTPELAR